MSILTSIETARNSGVNDDAILNQIMTQNPTKRDVFQKSISRGAKSVDIINEIVKQNKGNEAIGQSGIDRMIEQKNIAKEQPIVEEKKESLLGKVGKFFTGATQKFAGTLGTAASVIDPTTKKLREETLSSAQNQVDQYLKMAKTETDKDRKDKLLKAASYLADTEDIDIFNNPEYQKTAKQVYGEAVGVAAETLGWGKIGGVLKGAKTVTAAQTALKSALSSGIIGATTSAGKAMEENKSIGDITKSAIGGGVSSAILGGAIGYGAGKLVGKIGKKEATKLVAKRLTDKGKVAAYKSGRATEAGLLKGEKILPTKKETELGKLAQEIGLKGNTKKDIANVNTTIEKEAKILKENLRNSGAIYNKNNVKGTLNKMKGDKTIDLIDSEVGVYDKMIDKFNKMVDTKKNKGLDGLLELRQEFDQWAKSNNPNIFVNKRGGAYRALSSVRDSINGYINKKVGDDVVKQSLNKQSSLYTILENISEKAALGATKLKPGKLLTGTKKILPWAGGIAGLEALRRTIANKTSGGSTDYTQEQ